MNEQYTFTLEEYVELIQRMYQRGVIAAVECAIESMVTSDCGCNFDDAIDLMHDALHQEIERYEANHGPYTPPDMGDGDDL